MRGPIIPATRYVLFSRGNSIFISPFRYCLRIIAIGLALSIFVICLSEFFNRQQIIISIATNRSPACKGAENGQNQQEIQTADDMEVEEPTGDFEKRTNRSMKQLCPVLPDGLGPVLSLLPERVTEVMTKMMGNETLSLHNLVIDNTFGVKPGGLWEPVSCIARFRSAIVIPFRERLPHLYALLYRLHSLLQKQKLAYGIFVVEQDGDGVFNKGRLMNAAFLYIRHRYPFFDCIIFHDVDMLPEDDRNMYACTHRPRHLSPAVSELHYRLPYKELIGGVLAISASDFMLVNGYSNSFWGWGGEDDDMFNRLEAHRIRIDRAPFSIGRYTMILHEKRKSAPRDYLKTLLNSSRVRYKDDGVNQLPASGTYIINAQVKPTFVHILVDIGSKAPWEQSGESKTE